MYAEFCSGFIHTSTNLEAMKFASSLSRTHDHGGVKELWCVLPLEYYSALKRDELMSYEKMWGKKYNHHWSGTGAGRAG